MSNIITNLHKVKIPDITHINKIPGIEVINVPGTGKLFGVKYFLFSSSSTKPLVIRLTSINKSFSELYGIDIYNKRNYENNCH